ncbi:MAG: oligosaccharide flippase family protein [Candidatus Gracilibacteria bacterium]|nr:oligosaccharide flippase family protein [Candidatus Gracilibacteria bacterium]
MLLKEESLSRKFITKGAWLYLFVFLTAPLGYVIRIILTGDLNPSEIGIIYGTISLLSLLGTYTDFGLTESLNYFLPKYIIKNDYARTKYLLLFTLSVQIITSTLVSLGLFFGSSWIAGHYFHTEQAQGVIQILTLYFIGIHLIQVITTFLNAIQNTKIMKMIEFFRMFVTMIGASILLFSGSGNIYSYSWTWIIGLYIGLIFGSIIFYISYYRQHLTIPLQKDTLLRKEIIKYSLGTLFSANVGTLLHQVDMQFLTYFLGVYDAGIYAIYLSLVGIPFIFLSPLISFLFPVISEIGGRGEKAKIKTIYSTFSTYASVIIAWMAGLFFVSSEEIAAFLFGETFLGSGIALYFVAPFLIFNILVQINFQILGGLGFVRKRIEILIWTLLLNISVNLICILGYKYGYIPFPNGSAAASFSVGISWILMWFLSYRAIHEYTVGFNWRFFLQNIGAIIFFMIAFVLLEDGRDITFGLTGRLQYAPSIGFALLGSLTIFFIVNTSHIKEFLSTVRKVRSGML